MVSFLIVHTRKKKKRILAVLPEGPKMYSDSKACASNCSDGVLTVRVCVVLPRGIKEGSFCWAEETASRQAPGISVRCHDEEEASEWRWRRRTLMLCKVAEKALTLDNTV